MDDVALDGVLGLRDSGRRDFFRVKWGILIALNINTKKDKNMKNELIMTVAAISLLACGGGGGSGGSGTINTDAEDGVVLNGSGVILTDDGEALSIDQMGLRASSTNGNVLNTYAFNPESFFNPTSDAVAAIAIGSDGTALTGISGTQVTPVANATYSGSYTLLSASADLEESFFTGNGSFNVNIDNGTIETDSGDLDIDASINGGTLSGTVTYTGDDFSVAAGETTEINGGFYDTDGRVLAGVFEGSDSSFVGAVNVQTIGSSLITR